MFAVSETRKNRESHLSQRSGRTKTMASILSTIPLRFDWWIRSLWQSGQCFMSLLPVPGKAAPTGRVSMRLTRELLCKTAQTGAIS
jgi:hypothetical protein